MTSLGVVDDVRFERLVEVTERMRRQVLEAGSTVRVHEEDILEAARLVKALKDEAYCPDCGGHGWLMEPGPDPFLPNQIPCQRCEGMGVIRV